MRKQAADLAIKHTDELGAPRNRNAEKPLDRERIRVLLIHRRDVVEPIQIRHVLQVRARLHQFFGAAMQEADMRVDPLDHLAVELEHEAQHAMRRRMLRPEVDREIAEVRLVHDLAAYDRPSPFAFSSPGNGGPSHGLRKSNWRNS